VIGICSIGRIILIGENRSTGRKTSPCATLSTANPTWTDLVLNPGVRGERPATSGLSRGTAERCSVMLLIHWFAVIGSLMSGSHVGRQVWFSTEPEIRVLLCEIPGFCHCVVEACVRLECYAAWVRFLYCLNLKDGTICSLETSVVNN
jgi:hypothetical protein